MFSAAGNVVDIYYLIGRKSQLWLMKYAKARAQARSCACHEIGAILDSFRVAAGNWNAGKARRPFQMRANQVPDVIPSLEC